MLDVCLLLILALNLSPKWLIFLFPQLFNLLSFFPPFRIALQIQSRWFLKRECASLLISALSLCLIFNNGNNRRRESEGKWKEKKQYMEINFCMTTGNSLWHLLIFFCLGKLFFIISFFLCIYPEDILLRFLYLNIFRLLKILSNSLCIWLKKE